MPLEIDITLPCYVPLNHTQQYGSKMYRLVYHVNQATFERYKWSSLLMEYIPCTDAEWVEVPCDWIDTHRCYHQRSRNKQGLYGNF